MKRQRNSMMALFAHPIPYFAEIREIAGSVLASILTVQLEYWFEKYEHFYKFLEPAPNHTAYRAGDSWAEELGFSADEFRSAFDRIGVRYSTKTAFLNAKENGDAFQGRFYLSYYDKREGKTHYYRNDSVIDAAFDNLVKRRPSPKRAPGDFHLPKSDNNNYGGASGDFHLQTVENPSLEMEDANIKEVKISISRDGDPNPAIADSIPETNQRLFAEITATDTPAIEPVRGSAETQNVVAKPLNKIIRPAEPEASPTRVRSLIAESISVSVPHERDPLVARLVDLGITESAAEDLVADFRDRIKPQIPSLPYQQCRNNRAGYLRRAIEGNYAPPPAWITAQEAKVRKAREREQAETAAIEQAAREAQRVREEAQLAVVEESLSDAERAALERTVWQELTGVLGPIGAKAHAVVDGRIESAEALKSRLVSAEYNRVRHHLLSELGAKTRK